MEGRLKQMFIEKIIKTDGIQLPTAYTLKSKGFKNVYTFEDTSNIMCALTYEEFIAFCKEKSIDTVFIKSNVLNKEMCYSKCLADKLYKKAKNYYDYDIADIQAIDLSKYFFNLNHDDYEKYEQSEEDEESKKILIETKERLEKLNSLTMQEISSCFFNEWDNFINDNIQLDEMIGTVQLLVYYQGIGYITTVENRPEILFSPAFVINYNSGYIINDIEKQITPVYDIIDFIDCEFEKIFTNIRNDNWFLIGMFIKNDAERKVLSQLFIKIKYDLEHIDEVLEQKRKEKDDALKLKLVSGLLHDKDFLNCTNSRLRKRYAQELAETNAYNVRSLFPSSYSAFNVNCSCLELMVDEIFKRYKNAVFKVGEYLKESQIEDIAQSLLRFRC